MNQTEKINFRQTRDFGEIFNVTVTFLRQNFKSFFSSMILIAGPFILISAIAGGVYQSNALDISTMRSAETPDFLAQYGISFIIYVFFSIISGIVSIGTTFAFMMAYQENGPGNFTTSDVSRLLVKNAGRLILAFFALLLTSLPFTVIIGGIGVAVILSKSVGLILAFMIPMFFLLAITLPNLMWLFSSIFLAVMLEQKPIFSCIGHTLRVMRGSYWWTWIIMVCAGIAMSLITMIFSLPQIIYQMFLIFSHYGSTEESSEMSILFIAVATICTFLVTLVHSILNLLCGFHYHSLVEKKDGLGLMDRIDEIGNTPNTNVEQQY